MICNKSLDNYMLGQQFMSLIRSSLNTVLPFKIVMTRKNHSSAFTTRNQHQYTTVAQTAPTENPNVAPKSVPKITSNKPVHYSGTVFPKDENNLLRPLKKASFKILSGLYDFLEK